MILQAAIAFTPPVLIAGGMVAYARRQAFEKATTLLLLCALALYYFHFYNSSWEQFTIDPAPHMDYVRFIVSEHRLPLPTDNMGAAARHPAAFYLVGAVLYQTSLTLGLNEPEQFTRHLAMACYAVFILMGTGILRLLLRETSAAYYGGLLILLFWPIGVTMGGRISCDVLLFAGQAGCLFALMRWQGERTPARLVAPFMWGGVAVAGKNSGVILLLFVCVALAVTVWKYLSSPSALTGAFSSPSPLTGEGRPFFSLSLLERAGVRVKSHGKSFATGTPLPHPPPQGGRELKIQNLYAFIRADLAAAILFALLSTGLSFWHGWILHHIEPYGYYWDNLWQKLGTFNPFLFVYDTALGLSQDSFWNMWLHTLLLGDATMRWYYPTVMMVSKILFLSLLFYAAEGLIAARRKLTQAEKSALALLAIFMLAMLLAAIYLLLRTANPNYMDARYAYPAMILLPVMHGIVMKHHREGGRAGAYRIGCLLACSFAAITIMLFATQYLA